MAAAAELERRGSLDKEFIDRWTIGFDLYMAEARKYGVADVERLCGLRSSDFHSFIALYEATKRVAVSLGNGIERGHSGGSGLRAAMALQALTGNHARKGAGVIAKPGLGVPKTTARLQRPDLIPDGTRTFNIVDVPNKLLDATLDPPVKAILIYNHNPVATHPNQTQMVQALSQENLFIAGCDVAMTDSMRYADVVLPAASYFEYADIYGSYGQNYLQRAEPVIPCVGQSQPNTEIFRRLAARFGFEDLIFRETGYELMDAAIDGSDRRLQGFAPSEIPLDRALLINSKDGSEPVMCDTVFPATPSGKIELFSADLESRFGYGVPRYEPVPKPSPFVLISPSSSKRTNATFGGCTASDGLEVLEINPADAAAKGVQDGDSIKVWNSLGEVSLRAMISDAVKPGVLYTPKGTWTRTSDTGQTVNALIPSDLRTDIERGACYNETFVDLALA
jgi:anaerobic selenocysteine-containing dehydrogenase